MPEINNTRIGELLRGVFRILSDNPNGLHTRQIFSELEKKIPPTRFEQDTWKSNPKTRRYETIIRFQSICCVKAGWLIKDRGNWSITATGKEAYRSNPDPEKFYILARTEYRQWKAGQPVGTDSNIEPDTTERSALTLEVAEENAWQEVDTYLKKMPPYDFQKIVAGLLEGMGHHIEWIAHPGPDGGIDIHATTDPLGISGKHIKVQAKRQQSSIAIDAIRSFRDTLREGNTGIYVSTGGFTKDAEKEARRGQRHLVLIDANRFFDLWISHYKKIPDEHRRLLPIKMVAFLNVDQQ